MKIYAIASAGVLAIAAGLGGAQAQVAYTNSALNGCYAHLSTSVDTGAGAQNRALVGTLCFDGNGHILGTNQTPALSGSVVNTNGTVRVHSNTGGTYSVTNFPGDGMGTFGGACAQYAFVLRNVDNSGLAHGFQYILTQRAPNCADKGPAVLSGGAEYQGPLK